MLSHFQFLAPSLLLAILWLYTYSPHPSLTSTTSLTPLTYYALGDSYASGIAAGSYSDPAFSEGWICSRFTGSYPVVLSSLLSQPANLTHLACAGARAEQIAASQIIPYSGVGPDLVTVSAGGNNVGFSELVDACVYHFSGPLALSCDGAINNTWRLIDANETWMAVGDVVLGVVAAAASVETRVLVTGYARFWNEDTDGDCDKVPWTYWKIGNGTAQAPTKKRRRQLNELVLAMNKRLAWVTERVDRSANGVRVGFVDIDPLFSGHRFCEDGVVEPQGFDDPKRPGTWFFQFHSEIGEGGNGTEIDKGVQATTERGERWEAARKEGEARGWEVNEVYRGQSGGYPLILSKLFHPTANGHRAIAEKLLGVVEKGG